MSSSVEIDRALAARLQGDATLAGLLPGGVWWDEAGQGKTAFCLLVLESAHDAGQMHPPGVPGRGAEDLQYLVKAVTLGSSPSAAISAAARIDVLLEDKPLTITGYGCLTIARVERVRGTEVDDVDPTIRWQHHGGRYRVLATPTGVPT
jgi:hypothetical protein